MLSKLISFNTESLRGNLPLIHFVKNFLEDHKVDSVIVYNNEKTKGAIYCTIGNPSIEGIVFSAHTDTVPAQNSEWSNDPFKLSIVDNKYYGRGTSDMKGFISILLALVPWFQKSLFKKPIHIALSYDEEVGCLGVAPLISEMKKNIAKPLLVMVGEPTKLEIIDRHKSCHTFETEFFGKKAHSCNPNWGCNSIYYLSEFVNYISQLQDTLMEQGSDNNFDPPYSTLNVGMVIGGEAHNIVPDWSKLTWNVRYLPKIDDQGSIVNLVEKKLSHLQKIMQAEFQEAKIINRNISNIYPLVPQKGLENIDFVKHRIKSGQSGVSYGTDGGFFSYEGWPTIVCGPGSIEQAHQPDEYIKVNDIKDGFLFIQQLLQAINS